MDLLLIIGAASVALLLLALALGLIVLGDAPTNLRLARYGRLAAAAPRPRDRITGALTRIGAAAGKGGLEGADRASLRATLARAGFYADHAVEAFFAIRVVTALGLGLLAIVADLLLRPPGAVIGMFVVMLAATVGLYAPSLYLKQRIKQRQMALRFGLPDAVDLMVVCLEAGGTLSSAMQRVESEFRDVHPVLSEHLAIVLMEMQAGSSRTDALTRLADRTSSEEVAALVTMLVQSEALGASMAQTMRVFAEQAREARYLDAERRASELPVKMAFPLVLFIFPSLMTVIFTPLVIRIVRVVLTMHPGH
jgi:tight adherence protein C